MFDLVSSAFAKRAFFVAVFSILTILSGQSLASSPQCHRLLQQGQVKSYAEELVSRESAVVISMAQNLEKKMQAEPENADLLKRLQVLLSARNAEVSVQIHQDFSRGLVDIASRRSLRNIIKNDIDEPYVFLPLREAATFAIKEIRERSQQIQETRRLLKEYHEAGLTQVQLIEVGTHLGERDILNLMIEEVLPIGISIEDIRADGQRMTPAIFYIHDAAHTEGVLSTIQLAAKEMNLPLPQVWNSIRSKLKSLLVEIDKVEDPILKRQLEIVLFYKIHEVNRPDVYISFLKKNTVDQDTRSELMSWIDERLEPQDKERLAKSKYSWEQVFAHLEKIMK